MEPILFVARQPIFDARNTVWGYEILYRANEHEQTAANADQEVATLKVVSSLLLSPDHGFRDAYVVINSSPGLLRDDRHDRPEPLARCRVCDHRHIFVYLGRKAWLYRRH
jgi:c-di-GMP-related signal transduction protein